MLGGGKGLSTDYSGYVTIKFTWCSHKVFYYSHDPPPSPSLAVNWQLIFYIPPLKTVLPSQSSTSPPPPPQAIHNHCSLKPLGLLNLLAAIFPFRQAYKEWKEAEEASWRLPPRRQPQSNKRVWENPKKKKLYRKKNWDSIFYFILCV